MRTILAVLSVLLFSQVVLSTRVHFYDHKVLRAHVDSDVHAALIEKLGLDVWSHDSVIVSGLNDVMVNSAQEEILKKAGLQYEVMIADVEQHLENERASIALLETQELASWYDNYHNLTEIYAHYQQLATTYADTPAKWIPSVGTSYENRSIAGFKFGNANGKKKIYIEGGQHAREWIGHATVAYITEQLLTDYKTDAAVKNLVDNIEFVVVPVVNVDGYLYTWASNRLWRKNRRANTGGTFGVDLNRNWDDHWGGSGSSGTPSSDTYRGTKPFSEPETTAVSKFYLANGPYDGAIDYHSYSQLILRPYGWTKTLPPNDAEALTVGNGIRDVIKKTSNVTYTSEGSWELYFTDGTAQDWFYSAGKAPLAYTIELRDTGAYGFQLPANQIIPTGNENYQAFKWFANYILTN